MTIRLLPAAALLACIAPALPAAAQGIDCARASAALDKAICASPSLMAQDREMAALYAASARDVAAQRDWLARRARECGPLAGAALQACLARAFEQRIAALRPTPAAPAAAAAWPEATPLAPAPTAAGPAVPPAAATLAASRLPGAGAGETLLTVTAPGRFTLRAESPGGTALQLVDMLAGPGDWAGAPGAQDGRLDLLLDTGTYKLRSLGDAKATGEARLHLHAFAEPEAPPALAPGEVSSTSLADGEQRSAWFVVERQRRVRIEAAGRALADLRLWREGRELLPQAPPPRPIEPRPGRPLNHLVIETVLEPGTYRATAYGGPARAWSEGAETPLHLRLDGSAALAGGWLSGRIGPFGSEVFPVTDQAAGALLDLAEPAAASLIISTGGEESRAALAPRERLSRLLLAPGPREEAARFVEVQGREGLAFQLRSLGADPAASPAASPGPGRQLLALPAIGLGGDEAPATALLARRDAAGQLTPLAGAAPRIGPGRAWRARFNLRARQVLLFEVTAAGPVALRAEGLAVSTSLSPLDLAAPGRADGQRPEQWNLAPGWYALALQPARGASGVLDLTIGPPGLLPEPEAQPASPTLWFGEHVPAEGESLRLFGNVGGQALRRHALPLALAAEPIALLLPAGQALDLPLAASPPGGPRVLAQGLGPQPASLRPGNPARLVVPAAPMARMLFLSWQAPAAAPPAIRPAPLPAAAAMNAGAPHFMTFARGEQRSLALSIPEGGLYRIETLGRLRMAGELATAFQPLGRAEANGSGQNMLIQRPLRAGQYRLALRAADGAGRLGLLVRPAPVVQAPLLRPEGLARAALPAGQGAVFPIEIERAGEYRLDLLALERAVTARLEDAEGWPLTADEALNGRAFTLAPGRYRLAVRPVAVEARVVARLVPLVEPPPREGHGPHPLAFGAEAAHQWREPAGREAPRAPDQWDFALPGPARITLGLSDGMVGDLLRLDGAGGRVAALLGRPFEGELPAGRYRLETRSMSRNDRLDYTVSLASEDLMPGGPRAVSLPARQSFAIAQERVVSLSTFGGTDLRATLRDAEGRIVARDAGRAADWNIALSRLLGPGRYTLELEAVPRGPAAAPPPAAVAAEEGAEEETEGETEAEPGASMTEAEEEPTEEGQGPTVELRLALPEARAERPLGFGEAAALDAGGVHRLALPAAAPGALVLLRAASSDELILSLERETPEGWRSLATARGQAPWLAAPAEPGARWRASVWAVEGGGAPIRAEAAQAPLVPQAPGRVSLAPVPGLEGLFAALVESQAALRLDTAVFAAEAEGRPARPLPDGLALPQAGRLWLVAAAGAATGGEAGREVGATPLAPAAGAPLVLDLAPGDVAVLAAPGDAAVLPAAAGPLRLWHAEAEAAIGLDAGRGMGLGEGSSLALAGPAPLRLRHDLGREAARIALRALEPALAPEAEALPASPAASLAAMTAQPLRLPPGPKRLRLALPAGGAAILGWQGEAPLTLWAGRTATNLLVEGDWPSLLLVNTGADEQPFGLESAPLAGPPLALPLRRAPGAAGALALPVSLAPGQRLGLAGLREARLIGPGGRLAPAEAAGPFTGWLLLRHGPGPLAAWAEGPDAWTAAPARPAPLPGRIALAGEAMALALPPGAPRLLRARTGGAVLIALEGEAPVLYPAGAEFQRYLPPEGGALRLLAAQEGPLAGELELSAAPIPEAGEGLGAPVLVAPGGTALFGLTLGREGWVGLGIRAEPDRAAVRLLDAAGRPIGRGMAQLHRLAPGRYVIEARLPAEGPPARLRPAVIGLVPRPDGPPPEIARQYQELAGRAPAPAR